MDNYNNTVVGTSKNSEFATHILNESGKQKAAAIQETFDTALNTLATICKPGRELSIVKTKLEEASFFAKKAMATDADNQQQY